MPLAILFYDVVLAAHIVAIVVAFGVSFAYPVIVPYVERNHPAATAALWGGISRVHRFVVAPAAGLALIFGIYLASDRSYWSEVWVTVPLVILIVVMGIGGAYGAPRERRLAELAARDAAAGPAGDVLLSEEARTLSSQLQTVQWLNAALVVVAVFFMAAKP